QAEPAAVGRLPGPVAPGEAVEEDRQQLVRHPRPAVGDAHYDLVAGAVQGHRDRRSTVPECVAQQVADDRVDSPWIGGDRDIAVAHDRGGDAGDFASVRYEGFEVDRFGPEFRFAGVETRDLEEIFYEPGQPPGLRLEKLGGPVSG